jgi:hypothetical protein
MILVAVLGLLGARSGVTSAEDEDGSSDIIMSWDEIQGIGVRAKRLLSTDGLTHIVIGYETESHPETARRMAGGLQMVIITSDADYYKDLDRPSARLVTCLIGKKRLRFPVSEHDREIKSCDDTGCETTETITASMKVADAKKLAKAPHARCKADSGIEFELGADELIDFWIFGMTSPALRWK